MIKRILWFFFVGVVVFLFLRAFPFDEPSRAVDWLVTTSFKVRNFLESLVDWLPFIGDNAPEVVSESDSVTE